MATIKESLDQLLAVDGALCAAIVDSSSGMILGQGGSGGEGGGYVPPEATGSKQEPPAFTVGGFAVALRHPA